MNNLQELADIAQAANKNLDTAIRANICDEIEALRALNPAPEIQFVLDLLKTNQKKWTVVPEERCITCILLLEELDESEKKARRLIETSEETIGLQKNGIRFFVDERFAQFMITYRLSTTITVRYFQKSGYGEEGRLTVQSRIADNTQLDFVCIEDSFHSVDPVLDLFPCRHPEKMLVWMMRGLQD